jgi:hypothetical protein
MMFSATSVGFDGGFKIGMRDSRNPQFEFQQWKRSFG